MGLDKGRDAGTSGRDGRPGPILQLVGHSELVPSTNRSDM